jgi:transcriptional regulator with XRE-family HTH domain
VEETVMADWTFGLGEPPPTARSGELSAQDRKASEAWVRDWSKAFRRWSEKTSLSQSVLAKRLGVSPMTVSRWTRGLARPTNDAAGRLQRLLDQEAPKAARGRKPAASASQSSRPAVPAPGREAPAATAAAGSSVGERLTGLLEGMPYGERIVHLLESLGHTLKQAIGTGAIADRVETLTRATAEAVHGEGKPERTSRPAKSAPAAKAAAPARGGRAGGETAGAAAQPPARAAEAPRRGRGAAEAPAAPAKSAPPKRGGRAKTAPMTWPGVIKAVQAAEGWQDGRNRKLADALQVAPSTISNWLGGHRTPRGGPRDKLSEMARRHGIATPA